MSGVSDQHPTPLNKNSFARNKISWSHSRILLVAFIVPFYWVSDSSSPPVQPGGSLAYRNCSSLTSWHSMMFRLTSIRLCKINACGKGITIAWLKLLTGTLTVVLLYDLIIVALCSIRGVELDGLSYSVICKRNYNSVGFLEHDKLTVITWLW